MTYVEAKFGLRIRDSKPSVMGARGHPDPKDVGVINSLASGKGHRVQEMVVSSAVELIFKETSMFTQPTRRGNGKKGKQSKSWSKSACKGKSKEGKGDGTYKGKSRGSKGAKGSYKVKTSKLGYVVLGTRKQETSYETHESAQT